MNISFVASEGVPFSKTGGLAHVVGALPRALAALGHQVSVYLPRYRQTKLSDGRTVVRSVTVPFDDRYRSASVVAGPSQGNIKFFFVEYPQYFDRDALYGTAAGDYPDNAERFALFCRTVLKSKIQEFLKSSIAMTGNRRSFRFSSARSMLRILLSARSHVLHSQHGYQGLFPPETLPCYAPWDLFTISKMEFFGEVNFLKGALTSRTSLPP